MNQTVSRINYVTVGDTSIQEFTPSSVKAALRGRIPLNGAFIGYTYYTREGRCYISGYSYSYGSNTQWFQGILTIPGGKFFCYISNYSEPDNQDDFKLWEINTSPVYDPS